jgi:uncharacterized membrane-anchored protein
MLGVVALIIATLPASTYAQDAGGEDHNPAFEEIRNMPWKTDGSAMVSDKASLRASSKIGVLDSSSAKRFLEITGNPPEGEPTIVAPGNLQWFAVYEYGDTGHVSDSDKIDPDALLKSLKDAEGGGNAHRRELGLTDLSITGWAVPPHYDPTTHNLEWGLNIHSSDGEDSVNYTTRHLGRTGVVATTLVTSPGTLQADLAAFREIDRTLAFSQGNGYQEFKQGDKVAGYGLAALIAGGIGAAAVKTGAGKGLFVGLLLAIKAFGKAILVGISVIGVAVAKWWKKLRRGGEDVE